MALFNLLIVGLGGQGVVSLARSLVSFADERGLGCISTLHKGGAQTLGSVSAELRFGEGELFGPMIPCGQLDLLLALDEWEALRAVSHHGKPRRAVISTSSGSAQLQRHEPLTRADAIAQLRALELTPYLHDWRAEAIAHFDTPRMCNYLVGTQALKYLPSAFRDALCFSEHFYEQVSAARPHAQRMHDFLTRGQTHELA